MYNIKNKMTEIKRTRKQRIYHNYYGNCEEDDEVIAVYGQDTVIFWEDDDGVLRGYFFTSDVEELAAMMVFFPKGCIIDYLTRTKDELREVFEGNRFGLVSEMHRMSQRGLSDEEKQKIADKWAFLREQLYKPENVKCADEEDFEELYKKLYEVFDTRESHLPNRKKLMRLIEEKSAVVYYENGKMQGFYMAKMKDGQLYGYQVWSGTGVECLYSMDTMMGELFDAYLKRENITVTKPSYAWVNKENKSAIRNVKFWGNKFDGLYDFVYEKI